MQQNGLSPKEEPVAVQYSGKPQSWMEWFGSFHLIIIHFPIALLSMTALAELLYAWYPRPIFNDASRFMLISGAILVVPTAILGLIYSWTGNYEGIFAELVQWHMWFGIATVIFAMIAAYLRESQGTSKAYYLSLLILFLLVNITGMFGGDIAFGPYHMIPPIR